MVMCRQKCVAYDDDVWSIHLCVAGFCIISIAKALYCCVCVCTRMQVWLLVIMQFESCHSYAGQ